MYYLMMDQKGPKSVAV